MPREIITLEDKKTGMKLVEILGIKNPKCAFCNVDITEDNFGGIFNNPNRISCDGLICLIQLSDEIKKFRFTGKGEVMI